MHIFTAADLRAGALALYERGESIYEIEAWIADLPVDDTVKAAVWLYAWSLEPPASQRREAGELLDAALDAEQLRELT